jgi:hypothetical protein
MVSAVLCFLGGVLLAGAVLVVVALLAVNLA